MKERIDFYKSNKALTLNVSEYFRIKIANAETAEKYRLSVLSQNEDIKKWEKLVSGEETTKVWTGEQLLENLTNAKARLEEIVAEYEKYLEERERFNEGENEKALKKALNTAAGMNDVRKAFVDYFKAYNVNITDSLFLENLVIKCFREKVSVKKLVKTDGKQALQIDGNGTFTAVIALTFETLCAINLVKPAMIPSVLRDKYLPPKKK